MVSQEEKQSIVHSTLERYKDRFHELIGGACIFYKIIGNGTSESPMWYQLRANPSETDRKSLYFANSQKLGLSFSIPLDEDDQWILYDDFMLSYNYFRDWKYKYIKDNHPPIYSELK